MCVYIFLFISFFACAKARNRGGSLSWAPPSVCVSLLFLPSSCSFRLFGEGWYSSVCPDITIIFVSLYLKKWKVLLLGVRLFVFWSVHNAFVCPFSPSLSLSFSLTKSYTHTLTHSFSSNLSCKFSIFLSHLLPPVVCAFAFT